MSQQPQETLLEFPCEFPIKVFGKAGNDLKATVLEIVRLHAPELNEDSISTRQSHGGKYDALTVTINAQSKVQLDAIYQDLTASPQVLMAL